MFARFLALFSRPAPPPAAPSRQTMRKGLRRALASMQATATDALIGFPLKVPDLPQGVVPAGKSPAIAMDSAFLAQINMTAGFPGYPYLSNLATRPEFRAMAQAMATEVTREWIELTSKSDDGENARLKEIEAELVNLGVRETVQRAVEHDCYFGRAQIFIDCCPEDTRDTPLILDKRTVAKGSLKRVTAVEPVWTTPSTYNTLDPAAPDFFKPPMWFMLGKEVHASRLQTIITRPLPDLLKPAFNFGGMSLSQLAEPYVENWLRTRQSVADLINNFSTSVLATDMGQLLGEDPDDPASGGGLMNRAKLFTSMRSNKGLMVVDKEREEFVQVNTPLSGLHELQAQSQEHMCAVSRMPAIILTGISPSGLNASSDGEIRVFYDWIAAQQEAYWRKPLEVIIQVIQLSLYGEIDPDIGFKWVPLYQMTPTELADIRLKDSQAAATYITNGVIDPSEERERLASDPDSGYQGLDTDLVIVQPDPEPEVAQDTGFEEGKHPRADNGQFGSGGGGAGPKVDPTSSRSIGEGIAHAAQEMGLEVFHHGSGLSQSDYVEVRDYSKGGEEPESYKIRVSNHQLPVAHKREHGAAHFEVSPEGKEHQDTASTNYADAVSWLSEKTGRPVPGYLKSAVAEGKEKAQGAANARRGLQDSAKAAKRAEAQKHAEFAEWAEGLPEGTTVKVSKKGGVTGWHEGKEVGNFGAKPPGMQAGESPAKESAARSKQNAKTLFRLYGNAP